MNFTANEQLNSKRNLRVLYFTPVFNLKNTKIDTYMTREVKSVVLNYPNIEYLVYLTNPRKKDKVVMYNERILQVNRRTYKNFLFLKEALKIFVKFRPQIVHSHYVVPSIIINFLAKIFRVPTILHGRGQDVNYRPYRSIKSKILLLVAGKLNKQVVTVCKSMKKDCMQFKIKKNKVKVIYNGIDFMYFNPKEKTSFSNQRSLELIHVGALNPRKAQDLIIEACKVLKDNNIKFHLTLIGEGVLRPKINDLINKYDLSDYVDLLGNIEHYYLPKYLQKADIMVFPSVTEGLPNAVLEAMSMKLVVIMTRVDGNLELVQDIGTILVDINNSQQLFDAIMHYYNNPSEIEIGGEINRNFIVNTFSWDKHAKEIYQVYNFLIHKRMKKNDKY